MKDRVFSGASVPDALSEAADALGLTETDLRYVVLDAGAPGGRGLQPTPARVAVLLEESSVERSHGRADEVVSPATPVDARAGIRAMVRAVAESAGLDVWAEVEEDEAGEKVVVHLKGADHAFFFGDDGRGDVLRALEHLVKRTYGSHFLPSTLRVACEGFQDRRDASLAEEARALADAVRKDGAPRTTDPLNGYERRIVHLALNDEVDVTTYSVGEGASRRVTVALAVEEEGSVPAPPAPDGDAEGGDDA